MCEHGRVGVNLCEHVCIVSEEGISLPGVESMVVLSWRVGGSSARAASAIISQGHSPSTRDRAFCSCHLETLHVIFLRSWGGDMWVCACSCILRGIHVHVSWPPYLLHLTFPVDYYCLLSPDRAEFRKGCDRVDMSHIICDLGIVIISLCAGKTDCMLQFIWWTTCVRRNQPQKTPISGSSLGSLSHFFFQLLPIVG